MIKTFAIATVLALTGVGLSVAQVEVIVATTGEKSDVGLSADSVIRNGEVIASEGDLAPDGFRYAGDPLVIAADDMGNHAWVWDTDNPDLESDLLLVYNGSSILLREHDIFQFDVDDDGMLDDIRMDRLFYDFFDLRLAGDHSRLLDDRNRRPRDDRCPRLGVSSGRNTVSN